MLTSGSHIGCTGKSIVKNGSDLPRAHLKAMGMYEKISSFRCRHWDGVAEKGKMGHKKVRPA